LSVGTVLIVPLPKLNELDEFRNAIAIARAAHTGNPDLVHLAGLVADPEAHVAGLRALIACLLMELDSAKRDANTVLTMLAENSAIQDAIK
jgi:hypothetical protein